MSHRRHNLALKISLRNIFRGCFLVVISNAQCRLLVKSYWDSFVLFGYYRTKDSINVEKNIFEKFSNFAGLRVSKKVSIFQKAHLKQNFTFSLFSQIFPKKIEVFYFHPIKYLNFPLILFLQ